jgi:hypothetical protein
MIAFAYHSYGDEAAFKSGMFFIFPLALIWFPEEIAGFTGSLGAQHISDGSPPGCVYAGGWFMLFLPLIQAAIVWMRT